MDKQDISYIFNYYLYIGYLVGLTVPKTYSMSLNFNDNNPLDGVCHVEIHIALCYCNRSDNNNSIHYKYVGNYKFDHLLIYNDIT